MTEGTDDDTRTAPDFALETVAGEMFRLSELRGRAVVLFFIREFT